MVRPRVGELLVNTVGLVVVTVPLCVVIGVGVAWLVERTDLPGRAFWRPLFVAPLAIPAFVNSYAWVGVIPSLHGLWAGVLITTLSYFPFMYLPVAATLRRLDPAVEESARALGSDSVGVFFRVVLPQLRLAILGGGLLIGVHLLAEFGAFAMVRFDTFTVAIFQQFQVTFDGAAGSMLAGVLVILCLVLLIAEAAARGTVRFARIGSGAPRAATPVLSGPQHDTRADRARHADAPGARRAGVDAAALAVDRRRPTCGRSTTSAPHSPRPSGWRRRPRSSPRCWPSPSHGWRCGPAALWPVSWRAPTTSPVPCPASSPRSRWSPSPSTSPDRFTRACR